MKHHKIVKSKRYGDYWVCIGHCCDMHYRPAKEGEGDGQGN